MQTARARFKSHHGWRCCFLHSLLPVLLPVPLFCWTVPWCWVCDVREEVWTSFAIKPLQNPDVARSSNNTCTLTGRLSSYSTPNCAQCRQRVQNCQCRRFDAVQQDPHPQPQSEKADPGGAQSSFTLGRLWPAQSWMAQYEKETNFWAHSAPNNWAVHTSWLGFLWATQYINASRVHSPSWSVPGASASSWQSSAARFVGNGAGSNDEQHGANRRSTARRQIASQRAVPLARKVFPRGPRGVLVGFQSWAQRPQKIQSHPNQRLQLPSLLDVKALLGRRNVTGLSTWTFGSNLLVLEFLSFYRQAKILIRMPKRSPKKKVRWHFWLLKGTVK